MTNFPNVAQGAAYNVFVQHYGGRPPYSWTVSAGALPTGLALTAQGFVSGTVDGACVTGPWNFTIRLTDGEGRASSKAFTITVTQAVRLWVGGTAHVHEWNPVTNTHLNDYAVNANPQSNVVCSGEHLLCSAGQSGYDHRTSRLTLAGALVWGPTILDSVSLGFPYYNGNYYNIDGNFIRKRSIVDGSVVASYNSGLMLVCICADGAGNVWATRSNGGAGTIIKVRCSDMTLQGSYAWPNISWGESYQVLSSDGTYVYAPVQNQALLTSYWVHRFLITNGSVTSWNFTPYDNGYIRSSCVDGLGNLWVRGNSFVDKIRLSDGTRLGTVALSGGMFGTICYDGLGYVWTPDTGNVIRKIRVSDCTSIGTYGDFNTTHGPVTVATTPNVLPALP